MPDICAVVVISISISISINININYLFFSVSTMEGSTLVQNFVCNVNTDQRLIQT